MRLSKIPNMSIDQRLSRAFLFQKMRQAFETLNQAFEGLREKLGRMFEKLGCMFVLIWPMLSQSAMVVFMM